MPESLFNVLPPSPRKGFYYRAYISGRRLFFSENEILAIIPMTHGYKLKASTGGVFLIRSSLPDMIEYEAPIRASVKGDHFFVRS